MVSPRLLKEEEEEEEELFCLVLTGLAYLDLMLEQGCRFTPCFGLS